MYRNLFNYSYVHVYTETGYIFIWISTVEKVVYFKHKINFHLQIKVMRVQMCVHLFYMLVDNYNYTFCDIVQVWGKLLRFKMI
jgi:hypothetical protein